MFSKKATKVDKIFIVDLALCKGQIKPEADWGAVDSPKKKRTDAGDLFVAKT